MLALPPHDRSSPLPSQFNGNKASPTRYGKQLHASEPTQQGTHLEIHATMASVLNTIWAVLESWVAAVTIREGGGGGRGSHVSTQWSPLARDNMEMHTVHRPHIPTPRPPPPPFHATAQRTHIPTTHNQRAHTCTVAPFRKQRMPRVWGSPISSVVTMAGPMGA